MGTIIQFPNQRLNERLEPLKDFLTEAEAAQIGMLSPAELDELNSALDYAWPGTVTYQQPWITKLVFAWAGFAIGFGLLPY